MQGIAAMTIKVGHMIHHRRARVAKGSIQCGGRALSVKINIHPEMFAEIASMAKRNGVSFNSVVRELLGAALREIDNV
jgi:hypothetical protein